MTKDQVDGHCLCQAIQFSYVGRPNWVLHCHCESCRRASSSAVITWISIPSESLQFNKGMPKQFISSPGVTRGFCEKCGSQISYENTELPGEIHLYAALLADPAIVSPSAHVFVGEQIPWADISDDLPRYITTRQSGDPPLRYGPKK